MRVHRSGRAPRPRAPGRAKRAAALSSSRLVIDSAIGGPAGDRLRRARRRRHRARPPATTALTNPSSSARVAAHHLGGEGELLGLVHTDALAEQPRRPEVEAQAPFGEDGGEARPGRSTRSGRRPTRGRSPAPTATPSTLAMTGTGQSCTARTDVAEHAHRVEVVAAGTIGAAVASAPAPSEIGAGAEVAPRTGQHHHTRCRSRRSRGTSRRVPPTCRRCTRSSPPAGRS